MVQIVAGATWVHSSRGRGMHVARNGWGCELCGRSIPRTGAGCSENIIASFDLIEVVFKRIGPEGTDEESCAAMVNIWSYGAVRPKIGEIVV